jgi:hypothetical protein
MGKGQGDGAEYNQSSLYGCMKNSIVKPTKNCQKGLRKSNRGVNLSKVHYMHVWKYRKETPLYNEFMLIKIR